jgi:tight adherence protein B
MFLPKREKEVVIMIVIVAGLVFGAVFLATSSGWPYLERIWRWIQPLGKNPLFLGLGVFLVVYALRGSISLGLLLSLSIVSAVKVKSTYLGRRRFHALDSQLADGLLLLSNGLKAGFSLRQALEMVGREMADPLGAEIRVLVHELDLGISLPEAMRRFSISAEHPDVELAVTAILVQRVTGGNLAVALERIAGTINERRRLVGKVRAMTSQGRLTGVIISLMPVVLMLLLLLIAPDFVAPLLFTTQGRLLLTLGAMMQAIGALLVWRICSVEL